MNATCLNPTAPLHALSQALVQSLSATLAETPFMRFEPWRAPDDQLVAAMADRYQHMYLDRLGIRKIATPQGVTFEGNISNIGWDFEIDALAAGVLTYPRLAEVVALLADVQSPLPLRAAVVGPGPFIESSAVLASLGFRVEVREWDDLSRSELQDHTRLLPEAWRSRITCGPAEYQPVHIATWENPSPYQSRGLPAVDVVPGGFFLLQSEHCDALDTFSSHSGWKEVLFERSSLFRTEYGKLFPNFLHIFQRQAT